MDNLKDLLRVKNATMTSADLYFYGDIVSDWWGAWTDADQYPEAIRDFLKDQEGKDLNIYINSGGGSVFASLAIYNMLKRHTGKKTVYVDGLAASGASVIAMAGDEIIVPANAFLMIHRAWDIVSGNAQDLRKCADDLERLDEGIFSIYAENLLDGIDPEEIRQMVEAETWLSGAEAAKYFRVTTGDPVQAVACSSDRLNLYKNTPAAAKITAPRQGIDKAQEQQSRDNIKRLVLAGLTK